MRRIEVFLTFPFPSRLASILVPIYTPRWAIRSPKCLKDEVVSLTHNLLMRKNVFTTFMFYWRSLANVSAKKLASISQHSSISQADDVSSPYARVRSPSHAYDKVRPTEHPYAQVTIAGTSTGTQVVQQLSEETLSGDQPVSSRRGSHESLLANADTSQVNMKKAILRL